MTTRAAHAAKALSAARQLIAATADHGQPWAPVGAGIVTGVAYVGVTSSSDEPDDLTALGDVVNTASRLAGAAAAGEILASRLTIAAAGVDETGLERRMLALGQGRAIRGVPDSAVNTMMSTVSGWAAT